MEEKILQIVIEVCDDETIREDIDRDLIETSTLDSLAFIELLTRLEEEFHIEIQPTQVNPDTWRTVDSIIQYIKTK